MTNPLQLHIGVAAPHRNRYLFSDHYLENLLPDDPRWASGLAQAEDLLAWLQDLYAREQDQLPDYVEDQLEEHWFKPILRRLGHTFETQATVPGLDDYARRPDYVFFPDEQARKRAASLQNQQDYAAEALAVGEVKRWETPLGKKRKGAEPSFEDQNPSFQIDYYVRTTGLHWGILTNGRLWRLVHHDSSQRLNVYYEVDLVDLLGRGEPGPLRYFTLFFRQAAFRPDTQGRVFLDDVLAASNAYAVALEEDVEENVYRALGRLMQGFLDLPGNGLGAEDLQEIYDNSLYLLYRLLFVLYGESRGLLPMDQDQYRDHFSLEAVKRDIAGGNVPTASMTTVVWGRLQNLFRIINGDNAELNRSLGVPRYDGGLFDPRRHPFLEEKEVGDRALVEAVDLLSRRDIETGREFVDYRTLSVRHLGSIYEGLLEYQARIAEEPIVAVGDEWRRISDVSEGPGDLKVVDRREAGQVYLETDRGERKATGSYYTPQYIVEYIVEHTLGPLIEEATERVKAELAQNEDLRKAERQALGGQRLVDEILDLKCLDPAMGSGHFLVEATEYLARALATDPYVETEAPEEDLTHWKRRVVERCIYGVDKNPLAVELAKLSLWLATVAAERPLSFLDHHLKCGDSLIGAQVEDLGQVPPPMLSKKALRERRARYDAGVRQANLFETRLIEKLPVVMGRILEITEQESKDYDTVQAKEAADQAVGKLKAPFQAVADLWTSAYFGNEFVNGEYDEALMKIGQPDELMEIPAVRRAKAIADERRFFHWELAFPEVFYDEQGKRLGERAGFDVVVGNPPYLLLQPQNIEPEPLAYYREFEVAEYKVDIYHLFIQRGLELLADSAFLSYITPSPFLTNNYTVSLRASILENTQIEHLMIIPDGVFEEASVDNVVFAFRRQTSEDERRQQTVHFSTAEIKGSSIEVVRSGELDQSYYQETPGYMFILSTDGMIWRSLDDRSLPLRAVANVNFGMQLRDRQEFPGDVVQTQNPGSLPPDYVPCVTGKNVDRYELEFTDLYAFFNEQARRGGCWDRAVHLAEEKLVIRQIGEHPIVAYDDQQHCCLNTVFMLTVHHRDYSIKFLLSLLNSRCLQEYWKARFYDHKERFPKIKGTYLLELPVRRIDFTTPVHEREELLAAGIAETAEWIEAAETTSAASVPFGAFSDSTLARWLDQRLSADPEQNDVVHDLLAHLAERMITMHQQKQHRIEAFWLDLEGVTDPDTFEELSEHGKWESSLWKDEACRPFVDEESRSTRHLDESLAWNEDCFKAFVKMLAGSVSGLSKIVDVYRDYHPAYRELVRRIAATDRLIDLIVYRLYGLSEDEVAVVEKNSR